MWVKTIATKEFISSFVVNIPKMVAENKPIRIPLQATNNCAVLFNLFIYLSGFPLRLENLGKWEGIFQSGENQGILNRLEKSGNFKQTGKVRENHTKYWKIQGISDKYCLVFFSDI